MWDWVAKLAELSRARTPLALATVVESRGSTPREAGARMLVLADGQSFGTIGGGQLEHVVQQEARAALARGESRLHRYPLGAKLGQCCGGLVEVFIEVVNVGPQLYLFGAGHVGQALCRVLSGTPFRVTLIDEREAWLHEPGLPIEVAREAEPWDAFCESARFDHAQTYAVVMTHRHDLDQAIVSALLRRPARFLGLIGSRSKWARFRQRLAERGFTEAELDRVQCPVGLKVGGKAPQEVAISIAAELLRTHYEVPAPAPVELAP